MIEKVNNISSQDFKSFVADIKEKVLSSQQKAIQSVNMELVVLYWEVGSVILQHQSKQGWGAKIIDSLSVDLRGTFPNMKGFSVRNLKYMRQFASSYSDIVFVQEVLAQISWYQNIVLIQKVKDENIRKWYIF